MSPAQPGTPSLQHSNPWEARYQSGDTHWDKGAPAPGLVDFLRERPELRRGSVAIPGCGFGHDVRAWADFGFNASGFDIAPSAVSGAREQTAIWAKARPDSRAMTNIPAFVRADFLREDPPFKFDYVFEHTLFCAIQPAEREAYVEALLRWIKPGGTYLAINYMVCDPDGPPFPSTREELWRRFCPHFHIIDQWVPRSYHNRTGRELMCWWRRKQ